MTTTDQNNQHHIGSYTTVSKSNNTRIWTVLPQNKILLTASCHNATHTVQGGVTMRVNLADDPNIAIGTPLICLGIPIVGMVISLQPLPSPLDDGVVRVMIGYI